VKTEPLMMSQKKKRALAADLKRILKPLAHQDNLAKRIETISEQFLDCPYVTNSLVGNADVPEQLTIKLDGFDCVTYMETVLALALSETAEQFTESLIRIRYKNGLVEWQQRNHYMADWWRNNGRQGLLRNLTRGAEAVEKKRELNVIKDLPNVRASFRVFPKKKIAHIEKLIKTGDFACFATTKKNLDVFHTGILLRRDGKILLRHASRTAKKVIDQDLREFIKNNRMSGLVLLRPIGG
jgi:hypothetical protein